MSDKPVEMKPSNQPQDGKSHAIISSISNILAHTFSRKFSLSETVNTSIFTIFMAGLTWVSTSGTSRNFMSKFLTQLRFNRNPLRILSNKNYKSGDVCDEMMVSKFIEYMSCYREFFNCSNDVVIGDMRVQFGKMREPISFHDKNFNVVGKVQFYEVEQQVQTQVANTSHPPNCLCQTCRNSKALSEPVITKKSELRISIYDCVCPDITEYIKSVVQHEALTQKIPIKTMKYYISGSYMSRTARYINANPTFYHPDKIAITDISRVVFFDPNKAILFNDTRFNVRGYIAWSDNTIELSHCDVPENYSIKDYIGDVCKFIIEKEKSENVLTLYNQFSTNKTTMMDMMYSNINYPPEVFEQIFIKTLFHPDIHKWWGVIKNINYHPNKFWDNGMCPRLNLLLHGPPGTGKSTFAHRIAMATKRHLINVKLSHYTKDELVRIFHEPEINGEPCLPKEVIYVLDEFDLDLDSIIAKSQYRVKQAEKIEETMDGYFKSAISQTDHEEIEIKDEKIKEPPKRVQSDVTTRMSKASDVLDSMSKTFDKMNVIKSDIVTVEDLLTIFQGAIPIEGCIIIAMTNKFDEIEKICPKLFRPGRLTPVYFGCFDVKMIKKVSKHYFGKEFETELEDNTSIPIPPAQIMELVSSSMMQDETYNAFIEGLSVIMKTTIRPIDGVVVHPQTLQNFTLFHTTTMPSFVVQPSQQVVARNETAKRLDQFAKLALSTSLYPSSFGNFDTPVSRPSGYATSTGSIAVQGGFPVSNDISSRLVVMPYQQVRPDLPRNANQCKSDEFNEMPELEAV